MQVRGFTHIHSNIAVIGANRDGCRVKIPGGFVGAGRVVENPTPVQVALAGFIVPPFTLSHLDFDIGASASLIPTAESALPNALSRVAVWSLVVRRWALDPPLPVFGGLYP